MRFITEKEVIDLIKKTFPNIESVPATISFTQSGLLSSLDLVSLIFEIEAEFDVHFELEKLDLKLFDSPIMIADTVNNMNGAKELTLRSLFDDICSVDPSKSAVTFDDVTYSYNELSNKVHRLANAFINAGIEKGSHTVIILENCIEYILSYFALFYVGAIPVPINTRWTPSEAVRVIKDSGAQYFIAKEHSGKIVFSKLKEMLENENVAIKKVIMCDSDSSGLSEFDKLIACENEAEFKDLAGSDIAMI
ncbi:MAG: class I adenylate-forming enzyme family protein [Ruminococcus sp.]|nr:class I adenylate-forming enzyme family protein [Ruminococcus sp.]